MTTAPTARTSTRIVGLDGPRGLACLCVLVAHTFGLLAPQLMGRSHAYLAAQMVVFFFVLSGFLIFLPFVRAVAAERPLPSWRRYAENRVRRVYPAYLFVFVCANLLGAVYVTNAVETALWRSDAGSGRITDPLVLLSQLTLVSNLIPSQLQTGVNPSWSLTTELCFYLSLPLFVLLLGWLVRRYGWRLRIAILPAVLMGALGLLGKIALEIAQRQDGLAHGTVQFGSNMQSVLARSVVGQGETFAAGFAVVVIFVAMERGGLRSWTGPRLTAWCLAVGAVGVVGTLVCVREELRFDGTFFALGSAAFILLVVEPTARGHEPVLGRIADVAPLRFMGDISLSVYLWHYPVLLLVARHELMGPDSLIGFLQSFAVVGTISIALGYATYRLVEKPAMAR